MILVTGGTGLVGSHLLYELLSHGKSVRAIKRASSSLKQTELVFKEKCTGDYRELFYKIEWVIADINEISELNEAMEGIDEIYHCAALVSFKRSDNNALIKTNIEATSTLVNLAIANRIQKFAYVSSVAALGRSEQGLINEYMAPEIPSFSSFYSKTKYYAEMEVWRGISEGLNAVIINPGVILGIGDYSKGSLKIFDTVRKGLPFYPPGSNGYIDASDVAKIIVLLMERDACFGKRYCIVTSSISYQNLFQNIASHLGVKAPTQAAPKFLGIMYYFYASLSALIQGRASEITLDLVNTSYQNYNYDHSLILSTLDYNFIPIEESIKNSCKHFLSLGMYN